MDDAVDELSGDLDDLDDFDDEHVDELPEDLDITGLVGPYEFPNNSKRKLASVLYLVVAAICIWLGAAQGLLLVSATVAPTFAVLFYFIVRKRSNVQPVHRQ